LEEETSDVQEEDSHKFFFIHGSGHDPDFGFAEGEAGNKESELM
jgi:hypothetical protein